jgi:hypothetical protein
MPNDAAGQFHPLIDPASRDPQDCGRPEDG